MEKNFLTVKEFSKTVGLNLYTIYRLIKKGEIEAKRLGNTYFIPLTELPYSSNNEKREEPCHK